MDEPAAIEFDPVADLFPMITLDERAVLRDRIARNGLRRAILRHEGRIADGRNRYLCCRELGIEPRFEEWDGEGSLRDLVIDLNLHRRHLTLDQRAAIAAEAMTLEEAEARERKRLLSGTRSNPGERREEVVPNSAQPPPGPAPKSRDKVAKQFKVGRTAVQEAKAIREAAPELFQQIKAGKVRLADAKREVKKKQDRERLAAMPEPVLPPSVTIEQKETTAHLPDAFCEMILTDPPYNISDAGKITKQGSHITAAVFGEGWDMMDDADYRAQLSTWAAEWARLLKPGGSVVSFIDRWMITVLTDALRGAGLVPKNGIAWIKRNSSPAGLARRHLCSSWEMIVWAVKPGAPWTFNEVEGWDRRDFIETNIIPGSEKVDHPTQKPMAVLTPLIGCFSNAGDLVLDPFAGSGSTGVAATRLGRAVHLIERVPEYKKIAEDRLSKAKEHGPETRRADPEPLHLVA